MRAFWEEFVKSWDEQIAWSAKEIDVLAEALLRIAELNGARIHADIKLSPELVADFVRERVTHALDVYAASMFAQYAATARPYYAEHMHGIKGGLPFVKSAVLKRRLDLNGASAEDLAALPGIGPKTAARIVTHRERFGPFRHITELRKIEGLDKESIRQFAGMVYLRAKPELPVLEIGGASELRVSMDFKSMMQFMRRTGIVISRHGTPGDNLRAATIKDITALANHLSCGPRAHDYARGTRATDVALLDQRRKRVAKHVEDTSALAFHGVILSDTSYYAFVLELLAQATIRVWVMMFYFRFEDTKSYATDKIMAELRAAMQRKVDVRIILDRQPPDDPRSSSAINENAFTYLRQHEIPVTFDADARATHSKLLLVDEDHVVLGSHNWTAGSAFAYRDTSLYLQSARLSSVYRNRFAGLWERYCTNAPSVAH